MSPTLPTFPEVAADVRELLEATEPAISVPASDGLPAVRLFYPELEALRSVFSHLRPSGEKRDTAELMTRFTSMRVSVLRAVIPGLKDDGHAISLVKRLGTDHPIMTTAWEMCLLPMSILTGEGEAEADGDEAQAEEADFPARPTK